jgi:hypothetical protein
MFDGYIMFTSDRLTATLIKGLRNELHALLQAKVSLSSLICAQRLKPFGLTRPSSDTCLRLRSRGSRAIVVPSNNASENLPDEQT